MDQKKLNDLAPPDAPKYTDKPISVTDNITPITQKKVEDVDAVSWANMSPTELQDQLITLNQRYHTALDIQQLEIANQIQKGIAKLQLLLRLHPENTERFF